MSEIDGKSVDLEIITTGGTIDKLYFDARSSYQVGSPQILEVLREANSSLSIKLIPLLRKDSLDLTDADRQLIRQTVLASPAQRIVITHGTDTMAITGKALQGIVDKTLVLTGAMQPAQFRHSDAVFNIGCALTAVQLLPPGVYIAMNGRIFHPQSCHKNRERNRFESTNPEYGDRESMSTNNDDAGMPIAITLEPGVYFRCTCGKSENLPFCDGHHRSGQSVPICFEIKERQQVLICSCGKTAKQPYCDGSCGVDVS